VSSFTNAISRPERRRNYARRVSRASAGLVVLALVVAAVSACGSSTNRGTAPLRSCGMLGVGIGWRVSAASTMSCRSAMTLLRAYFHGPSERKTAGYTCTTHHFGGRIRCVRDGMVVIAVANH
jgi:hypothetical protein